MERRKIKEIALELLAKYEDAEESNIWEHSVGITQDEEELHQEVDVYRKRIDSAAEEEYTIELKKIDARRSLVLWVTPDGHKKFVVCSYYDHEKKVGEQWVWGHYFTDLWEAVKYAKSTE